LIETNWGGTIVEAWSTPEGLNSCDIAPNDDNPPNANSYLFNAMINPLLKNTIYGALWYQGEANAGWNRDQYGCTFTRMINDWRNLWNQHSGSNPNFPFGFVQLATIQPNDYYIGTPMVRYYQTNGYGFVPNEVMENVFMAVSLDTFDSVNGIHPTNKQIPSQRLAFAGLNVAYGLTDYPTNGPFPSLIDSVQLSGGIQVDITYDQTFSWNSKETEGFYICTEPDANTCNSEGAGRWTKIPANSVTALDQSLTMIVDGKATALAYLWETTPVIGTEALPIYADDEFRLPGAPWWTPLNF